ncbi:hypothetical protein [Microbulbifer marinus]|uniref:LTXXQ motif family protein n=1 Tax=Microbulbifer marinus TaxID=658218 RepID=A0A1H3XJL5_9GAMM|nr:hypothetical protein [Microbulbifer marinus]SDZ99607.1 hypothetical protein SAMN05216562_1596 [Microbulbifer marinus]
MQVLTRPGNIARLMAILFSLSVLFCALQLNAEDKDLPDNFWKKYGDVTEWVSARLKLSPEQAEEALPILKTSFELKKLMLEDYGLKDGKMPPLTDEQKEELDAGMIAIRANTRGEMVKILNKEQLEELKKIQEEYHMAYREWLAEQ